MAEVILFSADIPQDCEHPQQLQPASSVSVLRLLSTVKRSLVAIQSDSICQVKPLLSQLRHCDQVEHSRRLRSQTLLLPATKDSCPVSPPRLCA